LESIRQDLRFAVRSLLKSPGFAVVSVITLALAIGVNTSIFSLVSAIVFADLPMQESETVALVRGVNPELEIRQGSVSEADFLALAERSRSFTDLAALTEGRWVLTGDEQPMSVDGIRVTANLPDTWKLPPTLGRGFADGEDRPGAPPVAMLTYGFWQDRYDGRPDVLDEGITLDGVEHTIVGVMSPELEFASFRLAKVVVPLELNRADPDRTVRSLFVSGRLAPGGTQEMATEEVEAIGVALADEFPAHNRGWGLWSAPVMESLIDGDGNTILLLLQLTVGMVILIACANVANMLLARATSRSRELAVRTALGAGRGRIVRQLLTESLMISIAAGALGLGVAWVLNRGLIWISAGTDEALMMAEIDARVLVFTLMVSLVAPVAFGLFPALRASGMGASATLRESRSSDGGRSGRRARGLLVTAQVSLALALMIVATILTRTVAYMSNRPLAFEGDGVVAIAIDLPERSYEDDGARRRFFEQAREVVGAAGGLGRVELTTALPAADFGARRSVEVEGQVLADGRAAPIGVFSSVSDGYFDLLGIPLNGGRAFRPSDEAEAPPVAVVSRSAAERYWPGEDPVGRRLRVAGAERWYEVVGVVADVMAAVPGEPPVPAVYTSAAQEPRPAMYLVSRTRSEPAMLAGPVREAVWSLDPQLPVGSIRTLERARYERNASNYALLSLFITFAFFALVMSAVGIYGVMAYSVSQRQNEIGLRMALGAEAGSVRWMIVGQGGKLLAAGLAGGLAAGFVMSRLLGSLVVGVSATDPLTFTPMPLLLAAVALVANLVPARRATRLDPAKTLRAE
jgi:putative ABC transport system permease protein